jgi:NADH-quinone oxidoreductase subunit N
MQLQLADLQYLAPELTLVIAAVVLAVLDLVMPRRWSRHSLGVVSLLALFISAAFVVYWMIRINGEDGTGTIQLLNHAYRVDDFANFMKLLLLGGTALVIFLSLRFHQEREIPHIGEYYYLFLPATLGAMMMTSSGDLITLYVGLELLSITSYIMAGLRKADQKSNEAAFKYIVNGSIASAFILYGMSFLYGMSGTTNLMEIRSAIAVFDPSFSALLYVSAFLMIGGFGFKVAAAPFHAWAPDVYQGSPSPVAAYLATVSKAASIAIMFRVFFNVYWGIGNSDMPIYNDVYLGIAIMAAASMIIGTAMALRQRNMRRLLALSGVANAGYLLVPLAVEFGDPNFSVHFSNFTEMFYYLLAYLFMNIGAFAVLMAVSRTAGHEEMKGFAGLYYRAPYTAVAMTILLLSLAGLPITGGFFGKIYILLGAIQVHYYWLAAVMIATSVASYYYYFAIIRQMYMRTDAEHSGLALNAPLGITIWICAAASVLLGLFPRWIIQYIESIYSIWEDFFIL